MSTDARDSLSPPPPVREGQRLCSGRLKALPITAGDQGDPQGGDDTAPPDVGDDAGFTLALSASGPHTTPTRLAVMVEGLPSGRIIAMQAVRTLPRRKRMIPRPSWIFRLCSNSSHPLLCRQWLLHRLLIQ